ncbi:hypothetical protein [Adlercreutzia caecimuris]|uniref:Uncharacterized protein n=1 Tax=Adlercreutzia caecimuris B7 TaxID=1235794 RepID=R9KX37_9ACTN|nr:hypothetical protein [Adlercreutzia caecimuris]EOS50945.1 hypothetical protein C811_01362 [Adlercreutzia caecimuris B7]NBJ66134.1 hypothetical protein [Adlercreutzia caecimuris]
MERKDPKDMTASELLRHIARTVEDEECASDAITWLRMKAGTEETPNYGAEMANALEAVANKIDAEIEAARRDAVKESKKPMRWFRSAIRQGEDWPEPRDGEKFREYLRRCFILLPRYEDGEPVRFGEDTDKLHEVEKLIFTRSGECCQMQDARGNMQNAFPGQRVKRPGPEMLGADGKPISVGETVYSKNTGSVYTVLKVKPLADLVTVGIYNGIAFDVNHASLTHTPPDARKGGE